VVVVNLLITAGWFALLLALDPNRRAKKSARTLLECYLLGTLSLFPTILLYGVAEFPLLLARRAGIGDSFLLWLYSVLNAGPVEELAKFLVFYALTRALRSLKEPLDGVLQAAAVALAFASVENLLYGYHYGSVLLVLKRAVTATVGHLSYAAIWGLFTACLRFGILKVKARAGRKVLFLAVSSTAVLHSLYNLLLDVGQWPYALGLDAVSLLAAFLIQRSLALAYLSLGDAGAALRHLGRCRALAPGNAQVDALTGCARILAGRVDQGEELLALAYARLDARARWCLRRTMRRLLDRRQPVPGSPERAYRFHLHHFFRYARARA
jgi:RsiW-degrading membrane proteinase PrsW (M82 family)